MMKPGEKILLPHPDCRNGHEQMGNPKKVVERTIKLCEVKAYGKVFTLEEAEESGNFFGYDFFVDRQKRYREIRNQGSYEDLWE
jgi:hypothetical protein